MTLWSPDTCKCKLRFKNGPKHPPEFVKRCALHQEVDPVDVWDENRARMDVLRPFLERGMKLDEVLDLVEVKYSDGPGRRSINLRYKKPVTPDLKAEVKGAALAARVATKVLDV